MLSKCAFEVTEKRSMISWKLQLLVDEFAFGYGLHVSEVFGDELGPDNDKEPFFIVQFRIVLPSRPGTTLVASFGWAADDEIDEEEVNARCLQVIKDMKRGEIIGEPDRNGFMELDNSGWLEFLEFRKTRKGLVE